MRNEPQRTQRTQRKKTWRRLTKKWYYNIINATSAKEALEIILEEKSDAIVTDVVMAGISGFELIERQGLSLNIA